MKDQGEEMLIIDVLKEIHLWRKTPSKIKEAFGGRELRSKAAYEKMVIDGIRRALKEEMLDAFFYDAAAQIWKIRDKVITQEEYESNPLRKAHMDYIGGIKYRARDLDIYCIVEAFSSFKRAPGLKSVLTKALEIGKKELTYIHKETNAPSNIIALLAGELFRSIINNLYIVFYFEEWNALSEEITRNATKSMDLLDKLVKNKDMDPEEEEKIRLEMAVEEAENMRKHEEYGDALDKAYKGHPATENFQFFIENFISSLGLDVETDFIQAGEIESILPYFKMPNTPAFMRTQQVLNNPLRVGAIRTNEITHRKEFKTGNHVINYKSQHEDITWTIKGDLQEVVNGVKLLNFFAQKGNEQHWPEKGVVFNLQELVDLGVYSNKDSAYNGLTNSVRHMQNIDIGGEVTGYEGRKKKKIANAGGALISWREITRNQCSIKLAPIFQSGYIPITVVTDPNFYRLPKLAHMLLGYIMSCARLPRNAKNIKNNGYFTLSIEAIRIHLGLPEIKDAGKNPKLLIIDKIEESIGSIQDSAGQEGLKLEVITDYDTTKARPPATDYLSGYLKIEVDELSAIYLSQRASEKEEEDKATKLIIDRKAKKSALKMDGKS